MFPAFLTAKDLDFDAQKKNRDFDFGFRQPGHTNCIFFRCYDHFQIAANTAIDKTLQFRLAVAMMVDISLDQINTGTKLPQSIFKTFWRSDSANRANKSVAQTLERQLLARDNVLQIEGFMRAFN